MKRIGIALAGLSLLLAGCHTSSDVTYLQDMQPNVTLRLQEARDFTLQPGDRVSITVHSRAKDISEMFNPSAAASDGESGYSGAYYAVDPDGNIDFPLIGDIKAEGLTRLQLADAVKQRLISSGLVKEPNVSVDFGNLGINVTGEVNSPGRIKVDRDRMTLLEALTLAGDLTINGKRDNVLVLRTEDGYQTPYRVDLTNTESLYSSPVFYLKQNDLIYVEPTLKRANESKQNANLVSTPTFWISVASLVATIVNIIVR